MNRLYNVKKYERSASRLADWMEANIPEGLTVVSFPVSHRRFIRRTNIMEWGSQEIKRRTKVVRIFPNEASRLRLINAILMENDEAWQTGRRYLTFEKKEPPS